LQDANEPESADDEDLYLKVVDLLRESLAYCIGWYKAKSPASGGVGVLLVNWRKQSARSNPLDLQVEEWCKKGFIQDLKHLLGRFSMPRVSPRSIICLVITFFNWPTMNDRRSFSGAPRATKVRKARKTGRMRTLFLSRLWSSPLPLTTQDGDNTWAAASF
jgi:hypothetical protein